MARRQHRRRFPDRHRQDDVEPAILGLAYIGAHRHRVGRTEREDHLLEQVEQENVVRTGRHVHTAPLGTLA